jgi:hypothetical protein
MTKPMSAEHKAKIAKGVKAYHSCAKNKGCGKPKPKPKPKKVARKPVAKPKPKAPSLTAIKKAERDLRETVKAGGADKKMLASERRRITNMKKKYEMSKK